MEDSGDGLLVQFLGHLRDCNLSPATISNYMTSVSSYFEICTGHRMKRTKLVSAALHRMNQLPAEKDFKDPLPPLVLRAIADDPETPSDVRTALLLAWHAGLRVSNYTYAKAWEFDADYELCARDIRFEDDGRAMHITIRRSKTRVDRTNSAYCKTVAATGDQHCPVAAMRSHLRLIRSRQADTVSFDGAYPIFYHTTGSFLSRRVLTAVIKRAVQSAGFDPRRYSTHSLRSGSTTALVGCGLFEDSTLLRHGDWKSSAAYSYMRHTLAEAIRIAGALSLRQSCSVAGINATRPRARLH